MARHFKPVPIEPRAELLDFDPAEWVTPGDALWASAFRRWQLARHAWVEKHPNQSVLGDLLDCLRDEVRMKHDYWHGLSLSLCKRAEALSDRKRWAAVAFSRGTRA